MKLSPLWFLLTLQILLTISAWGESATEMPVKWIGGEALEGWTDVGISGGGAALRLPGEADFRYAIGPRGWYVTGFRQECDGAQDWRGYYGLEMDVLAPAGRELEICARLETASQVTMVRQEFIAGSKTAVVVEGREAWQRVTLPWEAFDFNKNQRAFLKFIQQLRVTGRFTDGKSGDAVAWVRNVRLVRAPAITLDAPVLGKAVEPGATATYEVSVGNCTDAVEDVRLAFDRYGWETMATSVKPAELQIAPNEMQSCVVSVRVPENGIPPGGHEGQKLIALGSTGNTPLAQIEFVTARDVVRPSILHTPEGWDEVREKVKHYDWARQSQEEDYVKAADAWRVPEPATPVERAHGPENHAYVFPVQEFKELSKAAVAWQLTRDRAYAEKVGLFLRRLADEKTGYPSTFAAVDQGEPQEGENWQLVAIAYDAILDAGVLSDGDKDAIEHTFRLYMETEEIALTVGNIGNWNVAGDTAALFCALAMGDLAAADRYLFGPEGFADYVTNGIMDDGWWWECATGYNFWVASELTQSALACRPWGIDLLNREFPAVYSPRTIITPWALDPPYGVSFEKWGPNHRNIRSVKQLWDAVPPVADDRGVTFGMNDGHEELIGGARLELGYYAFRDPAYAAIIKQTGKRDLIYGIPDLPLDTPQPWLKSGYAENIGYALLRSQTAGRPSLEQIEAVLKIGTQGGFHGHFDRTALNTIMRYGRSFWNPESIWYGYPNYMYKFYVQSSLAHNMVDVDGKQQEAVPSSQLLFHSGTMMQVAADETNARWSDPPYGGMQYNAGETFADQMRKNKQSIPLAGDRQYGELGPFSEPVLQRRLAIVTDDYIVLADYLRGGKPHTFDNIFQMKGFAGLEGEGKTFLRHDAQFDTDPHSAGQFITDCDWYQAAGPVIGLFEQEFNRQSDSMNIHPAYNKDGVLKIDIHSIWPLRQQVMVATAPENLDSQQWVSYEVKGDGRTLANGESGVWILGATAVDVSVEKMKELTLSVRTDGGKKKALFWANPRLITADGKEIPLSEAEAGQNVAVPPRAGRDYYDGPIKIAGASYTEAFPTQPANANQPAVIRIPLDGKGAVRFRATLGGDYPFGDETQTRKVYAIRSQGEEARFLTVLEPYDEKPAIKSAVAASPDDLRIELTDGRTQELTIRNLEGSGKNIEVAIDEKRGGNTVRTESTVNSMPAPIRP